MKKLLPLAALVLAGCENATTEQAVEKDPTRSAVTAFLQKSLDDPASYTSARWGTPAPWRQQDADRIAADTLAPAIEKARANADRLADKWATAKAKGHSTVASWHKLLSKADTVYMRLDKRKVVLSRSQDTTRLGTQLTHAYRAKNKMGALQLDSAHFVVYKSGRVEKR
jgi:hypothetical protein